MALLIGLPYNASRNMGIRNYITDNLKDWPISELSQAQINDLANSLKIMLANQF